MEKESLKHFVQLHRNHKVETYRTFGRGPGSVASADFQRTVLRMGKLEARVGFEPTNGGFADLSLRPLGHRAPACW